MAPNPVKYGYLTREYADRHMGAFRLNRPPMLERVALAVHQGNHCFAIIGKRAAIMKWLSEGQPDMKVEVTETYPWRKESPYSGLVKVTVHSVHVGFRFFYLMFGKKMTSKLMVEFSPWDGKPRPGEPMPLERDDIDAIPLTGEAILVRSDSTMAQGKLNNFGFAVAGKCLNLVVYMLYLHCPTCMHTTLSSHWLC
ncbi:hypothetical protein BGX30_009611 [Mortierella sp. GBA39]|nr:hypothetical protein BGX30_009611 [Mortierella sp. GBA39]